MVAAAGRGLVQDAWLYANDIQEIAERIGTGSNQRTVNLHPYLDELLRVVGTEPARLRAAAVECRERAAVLVAAGANPGSRRIVGYARAAALLEAAAAQTPVRRSWHGGLFWSRGWRSLRRVNPVWWRRRAGAAAAWVAYHQARRARDVSAVQAVRAGRPIGQVRYQVCESCGLVAVDSIAVEPDVRGVGVAARLVAAALRTAPPRRGYQWHAVGQPAEVVGFWRVMEHRYGFEVSQVERVPCSHMTGTPAFGSRPA
jgi:GNAT superfamily N-acetyltransferase